jgi:osmotically-inducible protein OsmY
VKNGLLAFTAACFLAFANVACDNTARGVKDDAATAENEARDEARDAKEAAKAEGRDEANDAARTANDATGALGAATETLDVKSALMADNTIDASDINVDTYHETRTLVLKGSVPTAAQKSEAGRIAAREAEGYKIDNQLVVKAKN